MAATKSRLGRFGLIATLIVMVSSYAQAEDGEFYVNTYRSIGTVSPKGLRSTAMGGAGRGVADGVASLGVNPAGIGIYSGVGFDTGLGYDWLDDGFNDADQVTFRLGGVMSLERLRPSGGPNQAVGAMLHTQSFNGAADVNMKRDQTGMLMAYGLQLMDDLLGGVSVALYDGQWQSDSKMGAASNVYLDRAFTGGDFKVGGIYRLSDETTMGGTLNYSTSSFKEKAAYAANAGSGSLDRYGLGFGVAHQYAEDTLLLGDLWYDRMKTNIPGAIRESNKAWGLSVGVEQRVIPEVLALRGGIYYDHTSFSTSGPVRFVNTGSFAKGRFGFTAGMGIKFQSFDIGYALDVNSGGDVKNLLDVSADW